jgi:hypothetical protein
MFSLSMPNRGSWNGEWSGSGNHYFIIKSLKDATLLKLAIDKQNGNSWSYRWADGWRACVYARVLEKGERPGKSDGFCGYDWMVDSILLYGNIKT